MSLSDRRRVELAMPARIAYRIVSVLIPVDGADVEFLRSAGIVFNAVLLEPLADLSDAQRRKMIRRLDRTQRELLAPYEGRGAVTAVRAFVEWLEDLTQRGILNMDPEGAFYKAWDSLATAIVSQDENLAGLEACARSARKMAAEWRKWFEERNLYV